MASSPAVNKRGSPDKQEDLELGEGWGGRIPASGTLLPLDLPLRRKKGQVRFFCIFRTSSQVGIQTSFPLTMIIVLGLKMGKGYSGTSMTSPT